MIPRINLKTLLSLLSAVSTVSSQYSAKSNFPLINQAIKSNFAKSQLRLIHYVNTPTNIRTAHLLSNRLSKNWTLIKYTSRNFANSNAALLAETNATEKADSSSHPTKHHVNNHSYNLHSRHDSHAHDEPYDPTHPHKGQWFLGQLKESNQ